MPRRLLLLVVALLLSGGTVLLAQQWMQSQIARRSAAPAPVVVAQQPRNMVLVARSNLPAGTFLRADSLRWQAWPEEGVAPDYVLQGKEKLESFVGAVVRSRLTAGEPVTKSRVVLPGERGFMAAVLTPGHRAVTVNVTPSSGVAGFIFPGDRVDLILTVFLPPAQKDGPARHVSETVLGDLRVLAMDQRADDDKKNDKKDVVVAKTATLEVTPKQAEAIAVVAELGKLSLSLRSLAVAEGSPSAGHVITRTWDSEATHLPIGGVEAPRHQLSVFHGEKVELIARVPGQ